MSVDCRYLVWPQFVCRNLGNNSHDIVVAAVDNLQGAGYIVRLRAKLHITKHFAMNSGSKAFSAPHAGLRDMLANGTDRRFGEAGKHEQSQRILNEVRGRPSSRFPKLWLPRSLMWRRW
jgi:hypothetical protein